MIKLYIKFACPRVIIFAIIFNFMSYGYTANLFAKTSEAVLHKPLRVIVRPRVNKQEQKYLEVNQKKIFQSSELFTKKQWQTILNHKFYSGLEDYENLKKFGYSVNSDIRQKLLDKRLLTNDPDNMLHLNEFSNKELYAYAPEISINPMLEIQRGCKQTLIVECGFKGYGQFWLKGNLRNIEIMKDRSDNALVNLIRSLD